MTCRLEALPWDLTSDQIRWPLLQGGPIHLRSFNICSSVANGDPPFAATHLSIIFPANPQLSLLRSCSARVQLPGSQQIVSPQSSRAIGYLCKFTCASHPRRMLQQEISVTFTEEFASIKRKAAHRKRL